MYTATTAYTSSATVTSPRMAVENVTCTCTSGHRSERLVHSHQGVHRQRNLLENVICTWTSGQRSECFVHRHHRRHLQCHSHQFQDGCGERHLWMDIRTGQNVLYTSSATSGQVNDHRSERLVHRHQRVHLQRYRDQSQKGCGERHTSVVMRAGSVSRKRPVMVDLFYSTFFSRILSFCTALNLPLLPL